MKKPREYRIRVDGRLKPNEREWRALKKELRHLLISQGFGLCSRGPMTFAMLSALYGNRFTRKMWSKEWQEAK